MKSFNLIGLVAVLGCCLAGCSNETAKDSNRLEVETPQFNSTFGIDYPTVGLDKFTLEIVDELYNSDESVREWVDSLKKEKGVYINSAETYDLVMLAAGLKETTGYGMAFVDAKHSVDKVYIVYSLIAPDQASVEAGQVLEQDSYPFMLLKLPKQGGDIIPYYLEESQIGDYMMTIYAPELNQEVLEEEESVDPLTTEKVVEESTETIE